MNEIDTSTHDELRILRERAYGPGADIDQDPAAVQRLRELESRLAMPEPEPEPAEEPAPTARPAEPMPEQTPTDRAEAGSRAPDVEQPTTTRRSARLSKVLWGLSVAAAAAAAASITFSLTYITPVSASGDATQVASLEPTPTVQVPAGFLGAGPSARTFEFFGYTIFEATGDFSYAPSPSSDCFVVIPTSQVPEEYDPQQGWSLDSPVYSGCRAGAFPAFAQFIVDSGAPEETRARFADGAALRFVFDGERVGVFVARD